ncbi:type II toxin-antitoxin system RelE/ParE family toxin [Bradyrhizobium elkanii]|uniref:type II toxin-antitoxin system RelE/ParE family toxin n=1 Tax=Bradyrhizobium elkanii TaxID=29448 RepID=UPI002012E9FC|nr:type II toxin-antitoxin system RelE/ParE family toxin [Bradyrhizobium elkanii]
MLDRIDNAFQMLAENPQAGRQRPERGMKIRNFTVGMFYEVFQNGVEIVRVLHGARDITPDDLD